MTENKQRKKIAFFTKASVNAFGKMLIFGLKNIDFFFIAKSVTFSSKTLSKTLFCNQDHHQTPFLVVFLAGANNEKSTSLTRTTCLRPWKNEMFQTKNCLVYSLKSYFFFYLEHHFVVAFSPKTNEEKN